MNPADSEVEHDSSLSFAIGLPIPVMWIRNNVEDSGDNDGTTNVIESAKTYIVKRRNEPASGKELKPNNFQSVMTTRDSSKSGHTDKSKNYIMAPGTLSSSWSDADAKSFLLGLFIFGKNFVQIKSFLENKGMGEILSFYYGKFYKSNEYRKWSSCRKLKGRKCLIGEKLFSGRRQHELLSRLLPRVSEESQDTLLQVSKSYTKGNTSLEAYISSLKSIVGLGVLVEAVGIGKEREDLTSHNVELRRNNRVCPAPTSKDWSSLRPDDILRFLTGGFRLSKAKSHDLFWEAIWPRLLAIGWHSEQPKNQGYVCSKDYLVFLTPGVKKFSRRKLVKGDHYFDSIPDVLSKVVAEPSLLDLEEDAKVGSSNDEEPEKGPNDDHQSDSHRHRYLQPRASTNNTDHLEFMVIDSSLVHRGKSSKSKSLPGNSVHKVEADAVVITYKGVKRMSSANQKNPTHECINQKLTKFTVIDTSMLYKGKLLKVRKLRYLPVELEDASKMDGLSRKSKGDTGCQKGISDRDATNQKEAYDGIANKMADNHQNELNGLFVDNRLNKTIKHQFSRRARSGHSNDPVLPIKRRRLTACAKDETNRILENSSGGLGSEKLPISQLLNFPDANRKICDPFSHQQSGSFIESSAEGSAGENDEESTLNEIRHGMNITRGRVAKCKSQVPPMSENGEMVAMAEEDGKCLQANDSCLASDTKEVVEKPVRTSHDVGSVEHQPDINPRRQSTRNRPLTVRALESLANDFLHEERKQKRKNI
ncbi:hypothetical protein RIF29_24471 [Crotalaria pallida]|uniref:SANT domain-containing protein n=1 Tax=Crotalaria pallida TaxID=3830 RepID=A0AAN9EKF3_CROPI